MTITSEKKVLESESAKNNMKLSKIRISNRVQREGNIWSDYFFKILQIWSLPSKLVQRSRAPS